MAQNRYTALTYQSIVLKYSSSNIPYYFSTLSTLNSNYIANVEWAEMLDVLKDIDKN